MTPSKVRPILKAMGNKDPKERPSRHRDDREL